MENMLAVETQYREHQGQMAWLNEENRQFERPVQRHPVRQAVAKTLIALATVLTPTAQRETQAI